MKKVEMISKVSEVSGMSKKEVELILKSYGEVVQEGLKSDDEIPFIGGGKFVVVERAERKGHNPKTKEEIIIPAHKAVKFKLGKDLKELFK